MKRRDLVNLSNGVYNITDSIYNYTLEKKLSKVDNEPMYIIRYGRDNIFLFEGTSVEDYEYDYPILTVLTSVGGMHVFSKDYWRVLNPLKFTPRGSFEEFIKRTNLK